MAPKGDATPGIVAHPLILLIKKKALLPTCRADVQRFSHPKLQLPLLSYLCVDVDEILQILLLKLLHFKFFEFDFVLLPWILFFFYTDILTETM